MFGAFKRNLGINAIRNSFDSAYDQTLFLPLHHQKNIAVKLKQKTLDVISDDPHILEQRLIALNQQSKFIRQTLVEKGIAKSQSDPSWLEACLTESFALAGLSGDNGLCAHVTNSLSKWMTRLGV
jgi:hypothetical protein